MSGTADAAAKRRSASVADGNSYAHADALANPISDTGAGSTEGRNFAGSMHRGDTGSNHCAVDRTERIAFTAA